MPVVSRNGDALVVLLRKGEEVVSALQEVAARHGVEGAQVSAIGAVEWAELGLYHLDRREYDRRRIPGPLEIASLQGSVSLVAGRPVLHAHTVVSDVRMQAFGGHLFAAEVGPSVEAFLRPLAQPLCKEPEPSTGLTLWRF